MESKLPSSKPAVTLQERLEFPPSILYENRYCNQDNCSILFCGGKNEKNEITKSVFKLCGDKLKHKKYTNMPEAFFIAK